IASQ
ncbi:bacterial regulatory s, gntR family protein, partial [Vibrio parahaemolyticus V-223/04]